MLSKGRQHWFQPAAQDNIADFTLAVVLRHGHYRGSDWSLSAAKLMPEENSQYLLGIYQLFPKCQFALDQANSNLFAIYSLIGYHISLQKPDHFLTCHQASLCFESILQIWLLPKCKVLSAVSYQKAAYFRGTILQVANEAPTCDAVMHTVGIKHPCFLCPPTEGRGYI